MLNQDQEGHVKFRKRCQILTLSDEEVLFLLVHSIIQDYSPLQGYEMLRS